MKKQKFSGLVYTEGEYLPLNQARIPITDLQFLRGFGAHEFIRTYNHKPFELEAHLMRLYRSVELLGLKKVPGIDEVREQIFQGLEQVSGEQAIKVFFTGGESLSLNQEHEAGVYIIFLPWTDPYSSESYKTGVRLMTTSLVRVIPEAKSTNYFAAVLAHQEAVKSGFDEALGLKDDRQTILEGTTFNFGAVFNKELIAPKSEVLPGITLDIVKKLTQKIGLKVTERELRLSELGEASEAFITSTTREVLPVRAVDDLIIGNGKVGPWTKKLMEQFKEYITMTSK